MKWEIRRNESKVKSNKNTNITEQTRIILNFVLIFGFLYLVSWLIF